MADTPNTSPEKPKKKIITVGDNSGGERSTGGRREGSKGRRGGRGRDRDERDRKPAVSPALMRGPKPKSKAEELPEEAVAEESGADAPEAEAPEAEATETAPEAETVAEPLAEATADAGDENSEAASA
ncbi:hypothetical protein [Leptolyngbya sp. KIOST-1]|uniref:hypothetical protein n=1 Tax=Leptolyngbya sp. KIOST-1 TaxID=1229172 RepID=UPI000689E7A5|nr:hypothetical protein [Leptolyngbya sp. KIOST-1]